MTGSEQAREIDRAIRCLVRASEALLMPTTDRKAVAILWCARALLHIASTDERGIARAQAEAVVREVIQDRLR